MDTRGDIVFYDGTCGLSHHAVLFLLRRDLKNAFRFAPVQGTTFRSQISASVDSMVVRTQAGDVLTGPAAWIYVLRRIGGFWRVVADAMRAVPGPVSEFVYRLVARTRYWFFGRRQRLYPPIPDAWPVPDFWRSRFDD